MARDVMEEDPRELAYDLRQIYARLVGEHLIDAAESRKANNFYRWLKALEDIKTVIKHKFKSEKEACEKYDLLISKIKYLANKYPSAWRGESTKTEEITQIDSALRELEEFLYEKMEESRMFGTGYIYEEDEI